MFGIDSRGNSTSMTAPMIWVILPVAIAMSSNYILLVCTRYARSHRCRAADDLRQFFRDRGLAGLVVNELELADELAGVVRSRAHRDHARRHFAGDVLHRAAIHLRFDVTHEQAVEDLGGTGLVDVIPMLLQFRAIDGFDGQQ